MFMSCDCIDSPKSSTSSMENCCNFSVSQSTEKLGRNLNCVQVDISFVSAFKLMRFTSTNEREALPPFAIIDCLVMNLPYFALVTIELVIADLREIDRFLVYFDNESAFHPINVTPQQGEEEEQEASRQ